MALIATYYTFVLVATFCRRTWRYGDRRGLAGAWPGRTRFTTTVWGLTTYEPARACAACAAWGRGTRRDFTCHALPKGERAGRAADAKVRVGCPSKGLSRAGLPQRARRRAQRNALLTSLAGSCYETPRAPPAQPRPAPRQAPPLAKGRRRALYPLS